MKQVYRDPFARFDIVRRPIGVNKIQTCEYCGRVKRYKSGTYYLYRFGYWPDSTNNRIYWDNRLFCSKTCRNHFHKS